MGKSNRIRANRANVQVQSLSNKKKNKGMPSWLMTLLTVIVAVVILASVVLSLLASNGIFGRMTTIVSTDSYKVNKNMMAYYFAVQYNDFITNNESLLSSSSLNKEAALKGQMIQADNYIDSYLTNNFQGSWYDFFMKKTLDSVSTVLLYCEEADALGIELTKDEIKELEASFDSLRTTASIYGYSLDAFLAANYGEGVNKTDMLKAMKYSALASKSAAQIAENLESAITDGRVDELYAKDPGKFNKIDYVTITLAETYADVQKELFGDKKAADLTAENKADIVKLYNERVAEYKALAEKLGGAADVESFKALAAPHFADGAYDTLYDSNLATLNKTATEEAKKTNKLPEGQTSVNIAADLKKEDLAKIKDMIVTNVLEAISTKAEKPTLSITIPEKAETVTIESLNLTVNAKFAGLCNTMINSLFTSVQDSLDGMAVEKVNKVKDNEFLEWAFEDGRALLNIKKIEKEVKEGDPIEGKDDKVAADGQTYSVSLYMLTKLPTKDTDPTRNGGYLIFEDEKKATAAITELKKNTVSVDAIKAYAEKNALQYNELTDYIKGSLGYATFDDWFYSADRKANDMTDKPIALGSYYAVALYTGESTEQWYVEVKNAIFSEDSEKYETSLKDKHVVTVREARVAKLDF